MLSDTSGLPIAEVRRAMAAMPEDQRELRAVLAFTLAR